MTRLALAGLRVKGQAFSEKFPQQVECVAAHVVQGLDGMVVNQVLPGLGIPSDIVVAADPFALGVSVAPRYDEMMLVVLFMASPSTGRQAFLMLDGEAMPIGAKSQEAQTQLLLDMLSRHPIWSRVGSAQGQSSVFLRRWGVVEGRPHHRHSSSGALEALWDRLHGPGTGVRSVTWDLFHRVDVAFWRVLRKHSLARDTYDMRKELENLFRVW